MTFQCKPPFRTVAVHGTVTLYLELLDLRRSLPEWTPSEEARLGSKVTLDTVTGLKVSGATWEVKLLQNSQIRNLPALFDKSNEKSFRRNI